MTRPERISYLFIIVTIALAGWLHLMTPFVTLLFSFFTLHILLRFVRNKWAAILLFLMVVGACFYGFVLFFREAVEAFPKIAEKSVPSIVQYSKEHNVTLPFEDVESLMDFFYGKAYSELKNVGNFAKLATKQFAFLLIGIFVAISLFVNSTVELGREHQKVKNNLYSISSDYIVERFRMFYRSFATVMGAQIVISAINTALTSMFLLVTNLPYAPLVIVVTFLCGLLPIIGNLISNSVIVGIAFTVSPKYAIGALAFLVVLHKLEYFLNSKIIGERIKNPMWLTLLSLVVMERLMGIPGMILAPVILHYLKMETQQIEVPASMMDPLPSRSESDEPFQT